MNDDRAATHLVGRYHEETGQREEGRGFHLLVDLAAASGTPPEEAYRATNTAEYGGSHMIDLLLLNEAWKTGYLAGTYKVHRPPTPRIYPTSSCGSTTGWSARRWCCHDPADVDRVRCGRNLLHGRKTSRRRRIGAMSPLPAEQVKRYVHEKLLTVPASAFTEEFVAQACRDLQIGVQDFPYRPGSERYALNTWARTAVERLAAYAPVAVVSNVSAFDTELKNTLVTGLGRLLTRVHVSYELGVAKPHPKPSAHAPPRPAWR